MPVPDAAPVPEGHPGLGWIIAAREGSQGSKRIPAVMTAISHSPLRMVC
jgi:hypothetical protein